jgi:hypothetical protein
MVSICTIGTRTTSPKSIEVCAASAGWPLAINDTSKDVPPMSPVMTFAKPAAWAICAQAMTPAAGPDSAVRTGSFAAVSSDITPPLLCTTSSSPPKPRPCRSPASRCR